MKNTSTAPFLLWPFFLILCIHTGFSQEQRFEDFAALANFTSGRLYALSEQHGANEKRWVEFETAAVQHLQVLADSSPDKLIELDNNDRSPLIVASIRGQQFLVTELLKHETVRRQLGHKDQSGLTAIDHAVLSQRNSIYACKPNIFTSVFAWIPLVVTKSYYDNREPYQKIYTELRQHGQKANASAIKDFWKQHCKSVGAISNTVEGEQLQAQLTSAGNAALQGWMNRQEAKRRTEREETLKLVEELGLGNQGN